MGLSNKLVSHPLAAFVHPPGRLTVPPELHHQSDATELDAERLGEKSVCHRAKRLNRTGLLLRFRSTAHQQQVPSQNPLATPHLRIRNRLEEADQVEIGCDGIGFEHEQRMTKDIEPDDDSSVRATVTYFESALSCRGLPRECPALLRFGARSTAAVGSSACPRPSGLCNYLGNITPA